MRTTTRTSAFAVVVTGASLFATACHPVDTTKLPLGDHQTSPSPEVGSVFACPNQPFNGGGAQAIGPWIDTSGGTWSKDAKPAVRGTVSWPSRFSITTSGAATTLTGNGLPSTPTGEFPVAADDPVHQWDANPNSVREWNLTATLNASPTVAAQASCVGGVIGVSTLGVPIFSAFDAAGRDAVANEVQDSCDGHPEKNGHYHFHSLSRCFASTTDADPDLFGYALDGFGIYVDRNPDGSLLSTWDLDACHGRTSEITWHGQKVDMYHYVATADFPYLVACFRGTPITSATGLHIGGPP